MLSSQDYAVDGRTMTGVRDSLRGLRGDVPMAHRHMIHQSTGPLTQNYMQPEAALCKYRAVLQRRTFACASCSAASLAVAATSSARAAASARPASADAASAAAARERRPSDAAAASAAVLANLVLSSAPRERCCCSAASKLAACCSLAFREACATGRSGKVSNEKGQQGNQDAKRGCHNLEGCAHYWVPYPESSMAGLRHYYANGLKRICKRNDSLGLQLRNQCARITNRQVDQIPAASLAHLSQRQFSGQLLQLLLYGPFAVSTVAAFAFQDAIRLSFGCACHLCYMPASSSPRTV